MYFGNFFAQVGQMYSFESLGWYKIVKIVKVTLGDDANAKIKITF